MLTGFHIYIISGSAVTVGAHRYFSHRSFKAAFGIRCAFIAFFTMTGQVSAGEWGEWVVACVVTAVQI
jgi:fatty-acid desaturase